MSELQAIPIWHFVVTLGVWLAFAAALYNAAIGLLGINAVKPDATKWPRWVWVMLAVGVILSFGAAWQAAATLRQADLDKRKSTAASEQTSQTLHDVQSNLGTVQGQLDAITASDNEIKGLIKGAAITAKVDPNKPTKEVIQEIIDRLPKPKSTDSNRADIKGNGNATNVGGSGNVAIGSVGTLVIPERPDRELQEADKKMLLSIPKSAKIGVVYTGPYDSFKFASKINTFMKENGYQMAFDLPGEAAGIRFPPGAAIRVSPDKSGATIEVGENR
jgi:hypothetical protein